MKKLLSILGCILASVLPVSASAAEKISVPSELSPWVPWVESELAPPCPDGADGAVCQWPTELRLEIEDKSAKFSESIYVDQNGAFSLPGSTEHWPLGVEVDGKEAIVVGDGAPYTTLSRGFHRISGHFSYPEVPETFPIGADVALLHLTLKGKNVPLVRRQGGQVWLRELGEVARVEGENESVSLAVHRHLIDGQVLTIETELLFRVSGKVRELSLPDPLIPGTIPLSVSSDLAVALSRTGSLRIQLLPGEHRVTLLARTVGLPEKIGSVVRDAPWPEQEIWVFEPNPSFRSVELSGLLGIDSSRTELPEAFKKWPAYLADPKSVLEFRTTRRGEAQLPPNRLQLRREFWLDESGDAFTVRDQWSGQMFQGFRLNLLEGELGGIKVDGEPTLITKSRGDAARPGVELRKNELALVGESRAPRNARFRAVGWNEDVEHLGATLHLPPGWDVFAALGVDSMADVWLSRWDLFDFFFLLVMTLATFRLTNAKAAGALFLALVLCHAREDAPRFVWLSLVVLVALVRFLPDGAFKTISRQLLRANLGLLVILAISFAIGEVRGALYPHLRNESHSAPSFDLANEAAPVAAPPMDNKEGGTGTRAKAEEALADSASSAQEFGLVAGAAKSAAPGFRSKRQSYGADVVVQTGPGIPESVASSWNLEWSGPVNKDHTIRLFLISKNMGRFLTFLRLVAMGLAVYFILRPKGGGSSLVTFRPKAPTVAATTALALGLLLAAPKPASAAPSQEILNELARRLSKEVPCDLGCESISEAKLVVEENSLELTLTAHAEKARAIRLPGPAGLFQMGKIEVDGKPAALRIDTGGNLLLRLDQGVHEIVLKTKLESDQVTLELGLRPRHITIEAKGYVVTGVNDAGQSESGTLSIAKILEEKGSEKSATSGVSQISVPPFYLVERKLSLGLSLEITTKVARTSDPTSPETFRYRLFPGEKVTTSGIAVEGGDAILSFPREIREVLFSSTLPVSAAPGSQVEQRFVAPEPNAPFSETWIVTCSVLWSCEESGLAPSSHASGGMKESRYEPWSGESLLLTAIVPEPTKGRSLTIENAELTLTPGVRLSRGALRFRAFSSRPSIHTLGLPEGARLESVVIDGANEPVEAKGGNLRIPVNSGRHEIVVSYQSNDGLSTFYTTPSFDLGAPSVNVRVIVDIPSERWLLFAGGPAQGPAILFWGYLVLVVAAAFLLPKIPKSPLKWNQWLLLGLGLTQVPALVAALVVGWFFLVASRTSWPRARRKSFNFAQVMLVFATLSFVGCLVGAVYGGLIGSPDMQVQGSGSYNGHLVWYVDRSEPLLPRGSIVSTSLWVYRGLMLAWSLWLAKSLLDWLKWALEVTTEGGFFESKPEPQKPLPIENEPEATRLSEDSPNEESGDISREP